MMPPLEMSLKALNVPFPLASPCTMDADTTPIFGSSSSSSSSSKQPQQQSFSPWSTNAYFSFSGFPNTLVGSTAPPLLQDGKRSVQFVSQVVVHNVLHVSDYTTEETESTWYNKTELRSMKRRCKEEAAQVTASDYEKEQMNVYDDDQEERPSFADFSNNYHYQGLESTVRGLESKTLMGAFRKKRHRLQAWSAVFAEQRWQSMQGFSDPDTLADVYFEVSEPCHIVANMVALRDAREVQTLEQWETVAELEKENQRGIWTSESSGFLEGAGGRRYQRLIAMQNRHQSQHLIVSSAA